LTGFASLYVSILHGAVTLDEEGRKRDFISFRLDEEKNFFLDIQTRTDDGEDALSPSPKIDGDHKYPKVDAARKKLFSSSRLSSK
jgi:hypothetical protein